MRMKLEAIHQTILEILKARGGCAYALDVKEEARISWQELVKALAELEIAGLAYRKGEPLDVTKPTATTLWCLREVKGTLDRVAVGDVIGIVVSPAIVRRINRVLPMIVGLSEFLEEFVCSARENMRVIMPYLSGLAGYLFAKCLGSLKRLKFIRLITEENEGNIYTLERLKEYLSNLEVIYATRYIERKGVKVKVEGAHAKVIVVDEKYAMIGTFNLTEVHLLTNYDIGVLITGEAVTAITRIFDTLWEALHDKS